MKARNRIGIHYFLKLLNTKMLSEEVIMPISPFWLMIYEKDDLKRIAQSVYPEHDPKDFEKMDEQGLLEVIEAEVHMLQYLMEHMTNDLKRTVNPTQENVFETLEQLGMQTHYLASTPYLANTPLESWDEHDKKIYQSLCIKAGHPIPYYGLYKITMEEENQLTINLIGRLHDTKQLAQDALSKLVADGKHREDELKIMMM